MLLENNGAKIGLLRQIYKPMLGVITNICNFNILKAENKRLAAPLSTPG